MSGKKSKSSEKREKKREKESEEKARSAAPGISPAKKLAVQEPKSSSSLPVPPEVAPLQPSAVVAKAAPPASKKIVKAVIFENGYPVEGQSYRPADEFSDDDDDASIRRAVILLQTFFSSCCDWVQLFFWIFYFIFRNWRLQNSTKRPN